MGSLNQFLFVYCLIWLDLLKNISQQAVNSRLKKVNVCIYVRKALTCLIYMVLSSNAYALLNSPLQKL